MPHRKLTCVIIDDDGVLRSLIGSILRRNSVEVVGEAARPDTALALCREHNPRLILLEINLPERSGLDLLPEIMALCPQARVVMISAEATIERVRAALNQGAAGFVVKPFTSARLLDAVGRSLGLVQ